MREENKEFKSLVQKCGMKKPGAAQVLGLPVDKVNRMYYGHDYVIPEALEALRRIYTAVKKAQAGILGLAPYTNCSTCGVELPGPRREAPEGGVSLTPQGPHYPDKCSLECVKQ